MRQALVILLFFYIPTAFSTWGPSYNRPASYSQSCLSPVEQALLFANSGTKKKKTGPTKASLRKGISSLERRISDLEEELDEISGDLGDSLKGHRKEAYRTAGKIQEYMENEYNGWECGKGTSRILRRSSGQGGSAFLLLQDNFFWQFFLIQPSWGAITGKLIRGVSEDDCNNDRCPSEYTKCEWREISDSGAGGCYGIMETSVSDAPKESQAQKNCRAKPGYGTDWKMVGGECKETNLGKCKKKPGYGTDWKMVGGECKETNLGKCKKKSGYGTDWKMVGGECNETKLGKCKKKSGYGTDWKMVGGECKETKLGKCKKKPGYGTDWKMVGGECKETKLGKCKKKSGYGTDWKMVGGECNETKLGKCKKKPGYGTDWKMVGGECNETKLGKCKKKPGYGTDWKMVGGECNETKLGKCKKKPGYGTDWKMVGGECNETKLGKCKKKPGYGTDWKMVGGECNETKLGKCKKKPGYGTDWKMVGGECNETKLGKCKKKPGYGTDWKMVGGECKETDQGKCKKAGDTPKGNKCICAEGKEITASSNCECSGTMEEWSPKDSEKKFCKSKCKGKLKRSKVAGDNGKCVKCPKGGNKDWQNDSAFGRKGKVNKSFCTGYGDDKIVCKSALSRMKRLIKELENLQNQLEQKRKSLHKKELSMDDSEKKPQTSSLCVDCVRRWRSIQRSLSGSQIFGNILSTTLGGIGSIWGINEARRSQASSNEMLALQGFPAESNFGYNLAGIGVGVPFLARGIHGLAQGNASRNAYACSPTVSPYPYASHRNPFMMY